VFGKLLAYDGVSKESFIWSRECTARPNDSYPGGGGSPAFNIWGTGSTSAHMFFFGGALGSPMRRSFFIGAEGTGATNGTYACFGTRIYYAAASPGNGGNWSANPERHLLFKTIHEADYNNANLIVWGNGAFQGSFLSFPQFGAGTPLGIFRASTASSFGAAANNRTVVADTGSGAFIDDINNGSYTFTNVITPFVTILRFAGGTVPIEFRFSDDYTNLQPRTTVVIRRGDGTIASSVVNTASSTFTATVVQATYSATANGTATPTNFYTTFNYGIKCYGFNVVSGTHTPYTYSLGTAGNGTDLKLGGLINQVADAGVTLTETNALALSSKITVNSGTSTITITANATYDELYDYTVAWGASSAANAGIPNLQRYLLTYDGASLSAPTGWTLAVNNGVTLSAGAKFNFVSFTTVTLTGSGRITGIYSSSAGTSTNLELRNVKDGAAYIAAFNSTKNTILFGTNATGTAQTYTVNFAPGSTGTQIYVARQGYGDQFEFEVITLVAGAMFYTFTDIPDEGISEPTLATVLGYTTIETTDKLYDRIAAFRMTEPGIKLGNIVVRAGTQLQFGGFSGVVNQSAAAVFNIVGSLITLKANALAGTSKYDTIIATPPATWTPNTNEGMNVDIEDANGDSSVNIQASGISTFEIWKITDATDPDDYDTGVLLDTVPIGKFRFIGVNGFKMVIRDTITNFRVVVEMEKGIYEAALFFGAAVQLAQAAEVSEINNKVDSMQLDVTNMPASVWGYIVETGHSALQMMRLFASVLLGKVSGAGTATETFRDINDTKNRVIADVTPQGDRTNITRDPD
jgi:hypothetical protein